MDKVMSQAGHRARVISVPEDIEEIFDFMYGRGMTDGLPVIPPTGERVERMMDAVSSPPGHVVAELPPRGGLATIEKLAINSVMAGCRPEYFPVVIAAVEAMTQPQFNLIGVQTTTNPVAPFLLLNGPVRRSLDVNCGAGALGPGRRANATIGRALRLILINIGGGVPGEGDKSILGSPGKYTFCLGELEEESPWEPFHVEHGFAPDESTVTVISSQGTQSCAASFLQPVSILMMLSDAMRAYGANSYTKGNGNPVVPSNTSIGSPLIPRSEMPAEPRLLDTTSRQRIENGKVCICAKADDIVVIVAGGSELNHAGFLASFGNDLAIRRIGD